MSAAELGRAAISAISALNPMLNAVITPMFDQARRRLAQGLPDVPFTGVAILLRLARDHDALIFFDLTTPSILLPF